LLQNEVLSDNKGTEKEVFSMIKRNGIVDFMPAKVRLSTRRSGTLRRAQVPSLISANSSTQVSGESSGVSTHDFYWTEMRANKNAKKYFGKYYGVDWNTPYGGSHWVLDKNGFWVEIINTIETFYPTINR
jgi:hypothetical protein